MKSTFPTSATTSKETLTASNPTACPVIKTGFSDGLGVNPDFTFLNLIQRSSATIAHMKQLKTCMDVWFAKHTAQLEDMEDILREMLYGLE